MPRFTFPVAAALWAGLALFAVPAHAAIFCVHDVDELEQALDAAFVDGTSDDIRLSVGKYKLSHSLSYYADAFDGNSLNFSGGWVSLLGACNAQLPDATLSEIDGDGIASIEFLMQGTNPGALQLFNFSVVNPGTTAGSDNAGLSIGTSTSPNFVPNLYVGNVIVRGCSNAPLDCGVLLYGSMYALLRNLLIVDNVGNRAIGVSLNANLTGTVVMNHVTVANNQSYTSYPGIYMNVPIPVTISNSILWGNHAQFDATDCDLVSLAGNPVLVNTTYGKACSTLGAASTALSNADPHFAGGGDYRPKIPSPAIDSGIANPVGGLIIVDLDGHARYDGALPDRGAYEFADTIFDNGFE